MTDHAASRLPAGAQDVVLGLFVGVVQLQGTVSRTEADPDTVIRPLADLGHLGSGLLLTSGIALGLRRRYPTAVFVATALVSAAYYSLDFPDGPGWLALFIALYTLTSSGDGRRSIVVAAAGITLLSVTWLVAAADVEPRAAMGWVFFRIGASVMSAALGESTRSHRVITARALERAEMAERTREEEARSRVNQERLRIAREVHDTVAHAIAVINVQAGVTAHVLDKRPERARETLLAIEQTSSRALEEMRMVLGVLSGEDEARTAYLGLDQLDDLVGRAREAGLDVKLDHSTGPAPALPTTVDAAAYRILQESITNIIRHVGPTRVTVDLDCSNHALEIRVTDEGPRDGRCSTTGAIRGRGLRGMRERCQLLGGRLDAGPSGAGFHVSAVLPLTPADPVPW